jgi:hypothetical protein
VGEAISPALILVLTACLLAAVLALVARRRRAGPVERQQLRWLVAAGVAFAGLVLVANVASTLFSDEDTGLVVGIATGVSWLLVPSAIGVAVTRHRLYDLDRLVSRTVSYALLTGLLSAVYLGVVAGLRRVLEPLSGTSQLAVGVSTLVVAAAFNPVRRRVQSIVDRRFDRSRYDAARTVDAYARRLRTEVDLDEVTAGLRNTVSSTVGPQRVALWLRDAPAGRGVRT